MVSNQGQLKVWEWRVPCGLERYRKGEWACTKHVWHSSPPWLHFQWKSLGKLTNSGRFSLGWQMCCLSVYIALWTSKFCLKACRSRLWCSWAFCLFFRCHLKVLNQTKHYIFLSVHGNDWPVLPKFSKQSDMIPSTENLIAVANIWLSHKQLKVSRVLQWKLSNSFINRQALTHCCWYIHRPFFLWGAQVFFSVPKVGFYSKLMWFHKTISAVIAGFLLYKKGIRNCHNTATPPLIPNVKLMFICPSEFKAAN